MEPIKIELSEVTLNVWQKLLDLMALKYIIPAALIMKIDLPNIKVFLSSKSDGNPYIEGDAENLIGSGLYCERVINTKSKLLVPDSLKDPEWEKNPDIKLGMISYVGFPILYPSGNVFGTICMLDSKDNSYSGEPTEVLELFKEYIESYLEVKTAKYLQNNHSEILDKEIHCDELLSRIEKLLGTNKYLHKKM